MQEVAQTFKWVNPAALQLQLTDLQMLLSGSIVKQVIVLVFGKNVCLRLLTLISWN